MLAYRFPVNSLKRCQRGAALLVMLVILVIGALALFVSSLNNSSSLRVSRDQVTSDALAKAKDALIAYAASDANRPGELPCPDFNNDGMITVAGDYSGSNCKSLVGWLPWKTLGIPELVDGNGDHLWYALANPFHANGTAVLNSDAPTAYAAQMLAVNDGATGSTLQSGVIAIVISPGPPQSGQARSPSDNNATNALANYLEDENANLDTVYKTANTLINDRLLAIDYNSLFSPVESRIAREARICLDAYAADPANGGRYPWAAPTASGSYTGVENTLFGRIPDTPNTNTTTTSSISGDPQYAAINSALTTFQNAVNACKVSDTFPNPGNLNTAANSLLAQLALLSNPPYTTSFTTPANAAASSSTAGMACDYIQNSIFYGPNIVSNLNSATSAFGGLSSSTTSTNGMTQAWPAACVISTSAYWTNWKSMVFYQLDNKFKPGGTATSPGSITVNGSGNTASGNGTYRAALIVARRAIGTQNRSVISTDPPTPYLEGVNPHNASGSSTTFETYKPSDTASYSNVNDLVLCVDGKVNCQ